MKKEIVKRLSDLVPFNDKQGINLFVGNNGDLIPICQLLLKEASEANERIDYCSQIKIWPLDDTFLSPLCNLTSSTVGEYHDYYNRISNMLKTEKNKQFHSIIYWDDRVCETMEILNPLLLDSNRIKKNLKVNVFLDPHSNVLGNIFMDDSNFINIIRVSRVDATDDYNEDLILDFLRFNGTSVWCPRKYTIHFSNSITSSYEVISEVSYGWE